MLPPPTVSFLRCSAVLFATTSCTISHELSLSQPTRTPSRVFRIDPAIEQPIVQFARENRSWGYDRIVGALKGLGHSVSDQTVGNVLKRHEIPPAPERKNSTSWTDFIGSHADVLAATDFFTTEVWTNAGLVTNYVLFFMHLATRKVYVAGLTPHPNEE